MVGMGGAMICRQCDPDVRAEMDRLRAEGTPVHVIAIARRLFRQVNRGSDYVIRDFPADLREKAEARAGQDNDSLREVILRALEGYLR
jgi:hypothetical protein